MSLLECGRCGGITNTALCDWVDCIKTGKAARCYVRWDDEKKCWVEGCAINDKDADKFMVSFARKTVGSQNKKYNEGFIKIEDLEMMNKAEREGKI